MARLTDISLFLPSLRGGGAERVMVTLANGFAERGISVDLVAAMAEGPYVEQVSSAVRIVDLKSPRILKSILPLMQYLRKERPKALLSTLRHANVAATIAHRLTRSDARLVLREASKVDKTDFPGIPGYLNLLLYKWAYNSADSVVGISQGVSDDIRAIAKNSNVVTIHNPVDLERVQALSREPLIVDENIRNRGFILSAGRLTAAKDVPTLLHAFALIKDRTELYLVIIGEGELREELETLSRSLGIAERVLMPGFSANPYVWMRASRLFVLSSAWEGFPNALIEAMACGTPIVSTDCRNGPSEILEGGKWGRLVPVRDSLGLAAALQAALADELLPNVRQRVEDFRKGRIMEKYASVLGLNLGVSVSS
ncbi:glycosyltransferase [Devosia sp. YIM 151766]|uniref:glycosyltransferase n=1 Tax=Devosia sp. YIM 151766 TaxID=3017325 RepID=UPI00255CDC94|nr:glycosyltransferase [Devosia sp. YIM 151766]WIY52438.1 glycosyltransferase [Devosia sp. YIM 151766]